MDSNTPAVDPPRVALVTGAAQRIGAAIVRCLHHQGFSVVIHYRAARVEATSLIEELNQKRPDSATGIHAELTEPCVAEETIATAVNKWGRLDLLVNNASGFFPTPLGNISVGDVQSLFGSNVQAPLLLSQAAHPHLKEVNGSIVNILDVYADLTHKDHSVYCASKAALSMLTKSLAMELAPEVRVNGISPGAILWPGGDSALSEHQKAKVLKLIPLQKMGSPIDIAQAVVYLAGPAADFITGQILAIDGGRSLQQS